MSDDGSPRAEASGGRAARRRAATSRHRSARRRSRRVGRRHGPARTSRGRSGIKVIGISLAGLLVILTATGAFAYEQLFGKIHAISLGGLTDQPAASKADAEGHTPLNILVLGSQTRDGQQGVNLGNASKQGTNISDTAMLVHLSAERKWADVVSIPRDLIVPRPQCHQRVGIGDQTTNTIIPASSGDMFDLAMNLGGPTCAVATVEQMTGIRIDHFVEIDFNAFQQLTDAVGGVQVCVPEPGINDPHYSGLVLSAGLHTVSGAQALEFVRDRHGIGDGSDLGRIQMQQMFVSSLFRKLSSNGTLANPITLYKVADAISSNLTVDSGLDSASAMVSLAQSMQSLNSRYIQFITAPYEADPQNVNRVIPGQGFNQVWTDLHNDQPLPGSKAAATYGAHATPAPHPSASPSGVPLSSITVTVYNGTTTTALASNATAVLDAQGVKATVGGNTPGSNPTTVIQYPAGDQAAAQALANDIPGSQTQTDNNVTTLTLILGDNTPANLTAPPPPTHTTTTKSSPTPAPSISAESRSGDENICSNLPTPVQYGGAP